MRIFLWSYRGQECIRLAVEAKARTSAVRHYAAGMPVIVVGADTALGEAAVAALAPNASELRVFVSDASAIDGLKAQGAKVAVGDVSDGSHIGGAALNAFCAVLIATAASDDRERSFASTPRAVIQAWAEGLRDAGVRRAIWVDDGSVSDAVDILAGAAAEFAAVEAAARPPAEIAAEIAVLEAQRLV